MNFKTTLVLLVLLAGVGAYLFYANRNGAGDDAITETKSDTEQKVVAVDSAEVEHLTVTPQDGKAFTLERRPGGTWRLMSPVSAAADTFAVDSLVREVTDLRSRNRVPLDADKQGLAKPAYTVALKDKSGKTTTLAVGARSAVGDTLYVKLDGEDKAHVVAGALVDQLEKPAMTYRQAKLVDATQEQIEAVTVARAGEPAMRVERSGLADWKMTEPMAQPADASEVSGLLMSVTGLSATEFVSEDAAAKAAQYALDKPQLVVTVKTKASPAAASQPAPTVGSSTGGPATQGAAAASQPAPLVIKFGRYVDVLKKDVYVAVEGGPVVKVPATTLGNFKKQPLELRDRRVVNIDPESVERLTISRDLQATTQPSKRDASKSTVVIARRVEKFAPDGPPAPTPAKKPDDAAAKPADPGGAKSDASSNVEGAAVLAAAEEKAEPPKVDAPSGAAAPKPDPAPATDAVGQAAAAGDKPAPASGPSSKPATQPAATNPAAVDGPPASPPSKWVLESEPKGDAGDSKVQSLLDALHPLRVQKYLAEKPKDNKSVGGYTLKVETRSTEGKPAQTYEIKLTDPGASAAVIGTYGDVAFEVERFFLEKLEGDFAKGAAEPPPSFPGFGGPGGGGLPPGFGGPQ